MSYSDELDRRIVEELKELEVVRKKMFGGICYLWRGNMLCGVYKEFLIARVGERQAAVALTMEHTKPFDITGKVMKGWVMVEGQGYEGKNLVTWLDASRKFVAELPVK